MDTQLLNSYPRRYSLSLFSLAVFSLLAACSTGGENGDNDDDDPPAAGINTLSGLVRQPSGAGLAGVTVTAGSASAISNSNGAFVLTSVGAFPSSDLEVEYDGTTAGMSGQYPELEVNVDLGAFMGAASLPQVITLPDLFDPSSSTQNLTTGADGSTDVAIDVMGVEPDMVLSGPMGTIVTIGGEASAQAVDLIMTPVEPAQVPMALPDNLLGSGFVTIQPGAAAFDPPGPALGLDVLLPNDVMLAVGSEVDIWSFDHEDGEWVNRSAETGQVGTVVDIGGGQTAIDADGVITEGGWHSAAIPVDPDCATTLVLQVLNGATGQGIAGANVIVLTGQFGVTGEDGTVSIPLVPAYNVAALMADPLECIAEDLCFSVVLPLSSGGLSGPKEVVLANAVVTGGTTDAGTVSFDVPVTGDLAGIVNGMGVSPEEPVVISNNGVQVASVVPGTNGAFFEAGLDAGDYTASYTFAGGDTQEVPFTIVANQTTAITIQFVTGGGTEDLTVSVFFDNALGDGVPGSPAVGAQITVRGTDSGSLNGLAMTAGADGRATFNDIDGPFDVTAQMDLVLQGVTVRLASSVIQISPTDGNVGLVLFGMDLAPVASDANLTGTLANPPTPGMDEVLLARSVTRGADGVDTVDEVTVDGAGNFSLNVPSDSNVDLVVFLADDSGDLQIPLATLIERGFGPIASGGAQDVDLDWEGGGRVDWDQATQVDFSGVMVGADMAQLEVDLSGQPPLAAINFNLYSGPVQTATVNLPTLSDVNLNGLDFTILSQVQPGDVASQTQSCFDVLTDNPASLSVEFLPVPNLVTPSEGQVLSLSEALSLQPNWTLDNGNLGDQGLEELILSGFSSNGSGGFTSFLWRLDARSGTLGFSVPPTSLPMFFEEQTLFTAIASQRLDGVELDFEAFFDEGVATSFELLDVNFQRGCNSLDSAAGMIAAEE